jgi:hypothetical protein
MWTWKTFIAGIGKFIFEHSVNFFKYSTGNNLIVYFYSEINLCA